MSNYETKEKLTQQVPTTRSKKFSPILAEYELQNVFNIDKAELVYCATLDRTLFAPKRMDGRSRKSAQ